MFMRSDVFCGWYFTSLMMEKTFWDGDHCCTVGDLGKISRDRLSQSRPYGVLNYSH